MSEAYPLHWPPGRPRTPARRRERARFQVSPGEATQDLLAELDRMRATHVVISSNVPLRRDGLPRASARPPEDPGVAVYFYFEGTQHVLACDSWDLYWHNIRAIGKTVEALRGIARWGTGDMMRQAVSAFRSLPAAIVVARPWREVLEFEPDDSPTVEDLRKRRRALAGAHHGDKTGDDDAMREINVAFDQAVAELGAPTWPK